MQAPYMWIGFWDPDRSDDQLLDALADSLDRHGARTTMATDAAGTRRVDFRGFSAFGPSAEELSVEPGREGGGSGGLMQIVVSLPYFDENPSVTPAKAWARFRDGLARLLADVRPFLVVCAVETAVDELPDPPADVAELLFGVGWVAPERLDERRRRRLDDVLEDAPRSDLAGGWWWSALPDLDPEGGGVDDPEALARAVYTAWTGNPATPEPRTEQWPSAAPTGLPELWLWAADRDEDQLLSDVADWAMARGRSEDEVGLGPNGAPGWFPVVVDLSGVPDDQWLDELRNAVTTVSPSWAGLLPESGIAVPGLTPEIPSTGVIPNVWVDHEWLANRGHDLAATLAGSHQEPLGGGTLYVTEPLLLDTEPIAEWCEEPGPRWDRLVEAAEILAAAARASRP